MPNTLLDNTLRWLQGRKDASEVSELLGVSLANVYEYADEGKLGARRKKSQWSFESEQVIRHLRNAVRSNDSDGRIPLSIAQFRALSGREPNGAGQCPFLKVFPSEFKEEDIKAVATALVSYFCDRDLTVKTEGWQDYLLSQTAIQSTFEELLTQRIKADKEASLTALLKVHYQNFPEVRLAVEQIAEIESWRFNLKPEEITNPLIAERVLALTNGSVLVADLLPRDMLMASEEARQRLAALDRDRLIRLVEAVVTSLIAGGLLKLIVWALHHVPYAFAAYPDEQVCEIEGVALKAAHQWRPQAMAAFESHGLTSTQVKLVLGFVLHGLVLLSYYGADLPRNPLIGRHARQEEELERLLSPSLRQLTGQD